LLLLKWEVKKRSEEFWHNVMIMGEERLLKRKAMDALSLN